MATDMKALARKMKGKQTGICPVCSILTYGKKETVYGGYKIIGTPIVFPCGISGPVLKEGKKLGKDERVQCPFETPAEQVKFNPDMQRFLRDERNS